MSSLQSDKEIWERSAPEVDPEPPALETPSAVSATVSEAEENQLNTPIKIKHCLMGVVTDMAWVHAYCVINNGVFKIFNSENELKGAASLEFPLDKKHRASPWVHKKFTKMENDGQDEHISFYIEEEEYLVGWTKIVKLGFNHLPNAERVLRCIENNTGNITQTEVPPELL